jgi:hypothetical protein
MSTCDDGVDGERKQQSTPATMWQVPNGYTPATIKGIPSKLPGQQETEKGRTEVSRACVDPTFEHKFWLECSFHLASNHHEPAPTISYSFHTKKATGRDQGVVGLDWPTTRTHVSLFGWKLSLGRRDECDLQALCDCHHIWMLVEQLVECQCRHGWIRTILPNNNDS